MIDSSMTKFLERVRRIKIATRKNLRRSYSNEWKEAHEGVLAAGELNFYLGQAEGMGYVKKQGSEYFLTETGNEYLDKVVV